MSLRRGARSRAAWLADAIALAQQFMARRGATLGFTSSLDLLSYGTWTEGGDDASLEFALTVQPHMCTAVRPSDGAPVMTCAAMAAAFDEVTTWSLMADDRTHRPGVSISIAAEMSGRPEGIPVGTRLVFMPQTVKIGRSVAFADVRVVEEGGASSGMGGGEGSVEVATGQHIKFLPMPLAWDLAMHPFLSPLVGMLTRAWLSRQDIATSSARAASSTTRIPLSALADFSELERTLCDGGSGVDSLGGKSISHTKPASQSPSTRSVLLANASASATGVVDCSRAGMANGLGSLHGGCAAMLLEGLAHNTIPLLFNGRGGGGNRGHGGDSGDMDRGDGGGGGGEGGGGRGGDGGGGGGTGGATGEAEVDAAATEEEGGKAWMMRAIDITYVSTGEGICRGTIRKLGPGERENIGSEGGMRNSLCAREDIELYGSLESLSSAAPICRARMRWGLT